MILGTLSVLFLPLCRTGKAQRTRQKVGAAYRLMGTSLRSFTHPTWMILGTLSVMFLPLCRTGKAQRTRQKVGAAHSLIRP